MQQIPNRIWIWDQSLGFGFACDLNFEAYICIWLGFKSLDFGLGLVSNLSNVEDKVSTTTIHLLGILYSKCIVVVDTLSFRFDKFETKPKSKPLYPSHI